MEPLDSDQFTGELRSAARKNALSIKSNIQKMVRIFSRRDMRDKLVKEFGVFKNNEIANFRGAYDKMKLLYQVKNGTSLEEYLTTQEQLKEMKQTTESLVGLLSTKQNTLD